MDVCLLGTGGMMPLPNRYLSALHVSQNGHAVMIDCGEGTQTAIRASGSRFVSIDALCITHYHADHISGLPGFLLTLGNAGREKPLCLIGPAGLKDVVDALCVIVPRLPYQLELCELSPKGETFDSAGMRVTAFPVDHGDMPCFGYRLTLARAGRFDPQRAKANGVPLAYWNTLQKGVAIGGYVPDDVLGEARRGINLLYATDTRPVDVIAEMGDQADLMVLEGMFGERDKQERAEETHHMTMYEAAELAARAKARELWLTHYSPANAKPELYEDEVRAIFAKARICADGTNTTLRFDDESPAQD